MISLVNLPAKPLTETLSEILPMPSLFRFLTVVAVIAGIVYGVVFALANFVQSQAAGNDGDDPAG
ncbi:hypothetical protein ACVWZV_002107 [Bradyrhizobium sp. GM5.1]